MKARSVKTPRVYSGRMAQIMVRIGVAREIGNSANLTKKGKQEEDEIIEEPTEQMDETPIVENVDEIIEEPVKPTSKFKKGKK